MSDIKPGDWVIIDGKDRRIVVDVQCSFTLVSSKSGFAVNYETSRLTKIEGCTGWDWTPPLELKEGGYYENASGEIVGPLRKRTDKEKQEGGLGCWVANRVGQIYGYWYFADGTNNSPEWTLVREAPPLKYRPFKDGDEFAPYRDRWVKGIDGILYRVTSYGPKCLRLGTGRKLLSYEDFLAFTFEHDGLPCGVKE